MFYTDAHMARFKQTGFTIVELLIVIVVIGILAAIVIMAFNGVQNRANGSSVRSDLASLAKRMEMAKVDSPSEVYPTAGQITSTAANGLGFQFTKNAYATNLNNLPFCRSTDGKQYAIAGAAKGGELYYISSQTSGVREYTWAWSGAGESTCMNMTGLSIAGGAVTNAWGWTNSTWYWAN